MSDQPTPQALKRWRWKRLAWVALVVVLGPYLYSRTASPWNLVQIRGAGKIQQTQEPSSPTLKFRIGTYNIAHGRGLAESNWQGGTPAERELRLEEIAKLLKGEDLDIVILNEVDFRSTWSGHINQAQVIAEKANFHDWAEQRNLDLQLAYWGTKFGNAVLSRYPIVEARPVEFVGYSGWETIVAGKKRSMVCTIEIAPKQRIRVMPIHLSHRSESIRVAAAKTLLEMTSESSIPLVLAGDFNSSPSGFPQSEKSDLGENAIDHLLAKTEMHTRPLQSPTPSHFTFPSDDPRQVIDWIMIPGDGQFNNYRVIDSPLSDHRPVIAEVELPIPSAEGEPQP